MTSRVDDVVDRLELRRFYVCTPRVADTDGGRRQLLLATWSISPLDGHHIDHRAWSNLGGGTLAGDLALRYRAITRG